MKDIIIGLVCVMFANILLGATLSKCKDNFSWNTLFKGVFKAVCVCLGVALIYLCGYLNPSILAVNIDGANLNLMDALRLVFTAGIIFYGYQDIMKLKEMLNLKIEVEETEKAEVSTIIDEEPEEEQQEELETAKG